MTKLERVIRQVSDLRDFYLKIRAPKKRREGHAKNARKPGKRNCARIDAD